MQGQLIVCVGNNADAFLDEFQQYGVGTKIIRK